MVMAERPPELQRLCRILEMMALIANHPARYTRQDLAQRFEVCERTISSDLRLIRNGLGYEIDAYPVTGRPGYMFRRRTPSSLLRLMERMPDANDAA